MTRGTLSLLAFVGAFVCRAFTVDAAEPRPLILNAASQDVLVASHAWVLQEGNRALTAGEALQSWQAGEFKRVSGGRIDFGYTSAVHWLAVPLRFETPGPFIVNFGADKMETFAATLVRADGSQEIIARAGRTLPHTAWSLDSRDLLGRFDGNPDESALLLVRYRAMGTSYLRARLFTETAFQSWDRFEISLHALFFGAMAALVLYNFFLYFALRRPAYLWYVVFVTLGALYHVQRSGIAFWLLWPRWPEFDSNVARYLGIATVTTGLLFARSFMELRQLNRSLNGFYLAVVACLVGWAIVMPLFDYRTMGQVSFSTSTIAAGINFAAGIYAYRRGNTPVRYSVIGWSFLFMATGTITLNAWGLIPPVPNFYLVTEAGMVGEALLLSLSLADQVRLLRESRDDAQSKFVEGMQRQLTIMEESARKGQLLAAAAHDVRQPLHSMRLYLGGLSTPGGEAKHQAGLDGMGRAVESLEDILGTLMDGAELESDGDVIVSERFAVQRVLDAVAMIFTPEARGKGLTLKVMPSSSTVFSDRPVLMRIVNNLVANAVRYTEKGRVTVGCRLRQDRIAIQVWDTGIGFSNAALAAVNAPLKDAADDYGIRRSTKEGYGLGLTIVRRLCQRLGAEFTVNSVRGKGSCVQVVLPAAAVTAEGREGAVLKGRTVALIDDNAATRAEVAGLLEGWGAGVISGANAADVQKQQQETGQTADAIISDLHLDGGASGLDAVATLTVRERSAPPALIMTFDRTSATRKQVAEAGLAMVYKPVDPQALLTWLLRQ